MFVFPTAEARRLPVTDGYTYHMRALAALLRRVDSYVEVPVTLNPKPDASSGVMKMRTLFSLAGTLAWLYLCRFTIGLLHRHRAVRREPRLLSGAECAHAKSA
jgi:hypothetical protein